MGRKARSADEILADLNDELEGKTDGAAHSAEDTQEAVPDEEGAAEQEEAKPKRNRKPRQRKPKDPESSDLSLDQALAEADQEVDPEIKATTKALSKDAQKLKQSIESSMDNMTKQWSTVKEITSALATQLERVQAAAKEAQVITPIASPARSNTLQKIASGLSALALLFSIVSLSLAQSARQAVVATAPPVVTPMPAATAAAPRTSWNGIPFDASKMENRWRIRPRR